MTFEEFFKKKRIDVDAFEKGNPALLFEFKDHFEKMGEKSFDHTKKYWFNKLRLQYHLAPEVKADKMRMENPLAEQTVADSLVESTLPEPRPAATSKFHAAPIGDRPTTEHTEEAKPAATKPGFTPRFKPGVTKPAEPTAQASPENATTKPVAEKPEGFTPRFKAGVTKTTDETPSAPEKIKPTEPSAEKPKGFTPRFKAGVTKTAEENTSSIPNEDKPAEPAAEKPKGFTPRFKAGVTKTTTSSDLSPAEGEQQPEEEPNVSENKPKIAFTPRFRAGITKTNLPQANDNSEESSPEN